MAYTDIQTNSVINLPRAKLHLRLDTDDTTLDPILKIAIAAAKEDADNYCQDLFPTVPNGIEMWILDVLADWWDRKSPSLKKMEMKDFGSTEWAFEYDQYFHRLKAYRREVGFASN